MWTSFNANNLIGTQRRLSRHESFNLALHQDLKPYIAKDIVTVAEADPRQAVFWVTFMVE